MLTALTLGPISFVALATPRAISQLFYLHQDKIRTELKRQIPTYPFNAALRRECLY
jgi:hypothetical protein